MAQKRVVTEFPIEVKPLTVEEREQSLQSLEAAKHLRMAIRKRRKGKLVPDSTPLIRQAVIAIRTPNYLSKS